MAFLRKIKAGLVKFPVDQYVGEEGHLFYNEETGELFISDGQTVGGNPIAGSGGGSNLSSTDDLPEGTSNLYYTQARVFADIDARVDAAFVDNLFTDADTLDGFDSTHFATASAFNSLSNTVATLTTSDIPEGTNLYYTDGRVNVRIDARVDKAFVDALNVDADTLDGNDSSFFAPLSVVDNLTTSDIAEGTNLYFTNARAVTAIGGNINDAGTATDDLWSADRITGYVDGQLSSGGGSVGIQTTSGIADADVLIRTNSNGYLDATFLIGRSTSDLSEGSNLYYTDARVISAIGGTIDDAGQTGDDIWSANKIITFLNGEVGPGGTVGIASTNGSIDNSKLIRTDAGGFLDNSFFSLTTDEVPEGSTNFYYATARFEADFANQTTDDLSEGATNLYFSNARAISAIGGFIDDSATGNNDIWSALKIANFVDSELANAGISVTGGISQADQIIRTDGTGYLNASFLDGRSTSDLSEGSNLYYTQTRFDNAFTAKSTTDLSEGSNLYYTDARVNADIDARVTKAFADALNIDADTLDGNDSTFFAEASNLTSLQNTVNNLNTDDIPEGSTNLYHTVARVNTLIDSRLSDFRFQNIVYVDKAPVGLNEFLTIEAAIAEINARGDASSQNPYAIMVGPGRFLEEAITIPRFVTLIGHSASTIITALDDTSSFITIQADTFIKNVVLNGPGDPGTYTILLSDGASGPATLSSVQFRSAWGLISAANTGTNNLSLILSEVTVAGGSQAVQPINISSASTGLMNVIFNGFAHIISNPLITIGHYIDIIGPATTAILNGVRLNATVGSINHAIHIEDGATVLLTTGGISQCNTSIHVDNVGAGPYIRAAGFLSDAINWDLLVENPATTGSVTGTLEGDKVSVAVGSDLVISVLSPTGDQIGLLQVGDIYQGRSAGETVNITKLIRSAAAMGVIDGGQVTVIPGNSEVTVAAGSGYVEELSDGYVTEVTWPETTISLTVGEEIWIVVQSNGIVTALSSPPANFINFILLGRVLSRDGVVRFIEDIETQNDHNDNRQSTFFRDALGPIYATGSLVSENATNPLQIDVGSGRYYFSANVYLPSGGNNQEFTIAYRDGAGGYTLQYAQTAVPVKFDNDSGTLQDPQAGFYVKHSLYVVGQGDHEYYYLVVGQEENDNLSVAEQAPQPLPPGFMVESFALIASILVQEGNTNIVEVRDERPVIGFKSSGISASTTHGNLLGLSSDDHPQYLRTDGSRVLGGTQNFGGHNITNLGTANGVTIQAHAARHLPNGADPLTTGVPQTVGTTNQTGTANAFARQDHVHDHGNQAGGLLHAVATQSVAGFMSAADKTLLDTIDTDDVPEGSSNLYYTDQRVIDQIDLHAFKNIFYVDLTPVGASEYSSVGAAVTAIQNLGTASPTNNFLILVGPGTYSESPFTLPSNVTVAGHGPATRIVPANNDLDFIILEVNSSVRNMSVAGPTGTGVEMFNVDSTTGAGSIVISSVTFLEATSYLEFQNTTANDITVFINQCAVAQNSSTAGLMTAESTSTGETKLIINGYSHLVKDAAAAITNYVEVSGTNAVLVVSSMYVDVHAGSVGTTVNVQNGAVLQVDGFVSHGANQSIYVPNVGAASTLVASAITSTALTWDLLIEHPDTVGTFVGVAASDKINVNLAAPVTVFVTDPGTGSPGQVLSGTLFQGDRMDRLLNISRLVRETSNLGVTEGGSITDSVNANEIIVAAGNGFVKDDVDDYVLEVSWPETPLTIPDGEERWILVNASGTVSASVSPPANFINFIQLGRAYAAGSVIRFVENSSVSNVHSANRSTRFFREALGPVYANGSLVSKSGTLARGVDISNGQFFYGENEFNPSGGTDVQFSLTYRDGIGGHTTGINETQVPISWDDGSGSLQALTAGYYAKHALYVIGEDGTEFYYLVVAQAEYDNLSVAEQSDLPIPPPYIRGAFALIASIVVEQSTNDINEILDERPVVGFKASGVSASTTHGNLLDLTSDDHPQYLRTDGGRTLTGNLDLGASNNIINVGTVNGVTVEAHASRHLPNGADPLTTGVPETVGTTNAEGIQNAFARQDHVHAHGQQTDGTLHADVTDTTAGFMSALQKRAFDHGLPTGHLTGGALTIGGGVLEVDASAGTGYVEVANEILEVTWGAQTVTVTDDIVSFIWINSSGLIQSGATRPDLSENIILGTTQAADGVIAFVANHKTIMDGTAEVQHVYAAEVVGPITVNGVATTINGTDPLGLDVDSGAFYIYNNKKFVAANTGITWTYWYRNGSGGWNITTGNTQIDTANYDDGSGTLAAIPAGEYKKDVLYVGVNSDGSADYHVFYGQDTFDSEAEANFAPTATPASAIQLGALRSAGAVVQQGGSAILGIEDKRPFIGQNAAETGTFDHGSSGGLLDNDHPQYLLRDGTNAMTADLDVGGFSVTNVNLVDGVDVSAHAARHLPSGADPLATGVAVSIDAITANAEGTAESFARSDHVHDIDTGVPLTLTPELGNSLGSGPGLARADHIHDVPTAVAITIDANTTNTEGVAASFARSDHTHDIPTAAPNTITPDTVIAEGTSANLARADHDHDIAVASAVTSSTNSNTEGVASSFARSDHTHQLTSNTATTGQIMLFDGTNWTAANSTAVNHYSEYAEAETVQSTISLTYVQALRLTATIPATGEYEVWWSIEGRNTAKDRDTQARVQLDDTTTLAEFTFGRENDVIASDFKNVSGFRRFNITAGPRNFDIDFRAQDATAEVRRVRIHVQRVLN